MAVTEGGRSAKTVEAVALAEHSKKEAHNLAETNPAALQIELLCVSRVTVLLVVALAPNDFFGTVFCRCQRQVGVIQSGFTSANEVWSDFAIGRS